MYLNGNNAAEGENNNKYANSYPMNCEELICTRQIWIVMIGNDGIEIVIGLGWVLCGIE